MSQSASTATQGRSRHRDLVAEPHIRRILVIKWSAMGDVALASAAIEDIAAAFPHSEVHLSTLPPWHQLYEHDPRLSRVINIDVRAKQGQLGNMWRWLRIVAAAHYDLIIDLQTTDRSRLLLVALAYSSAGVRWRAGNKCAFPYNLYPAVKGVRHAATVMAATLSTVGIPMRTTHPVLHCATHRRALVQQRMAQAGLTPNEFIVMLPGCQAAGYLKRWGAARFTALAGKLCAGGVDKILILGGPDELDECGAIDAATDHRVINWCGETELLDIVAICEQARAVIGNDTGTAHVAAAAERPMLIICGPTDPHRVRPMGDQVEVLQAQLPCINCYRKHCGHHSCMALIKPADVITKLTAMGVLG